jgi:DNA repair exonuclease SbcCD ATPase subunit
VRVEVHAAAAAGAMPEIRPQDIVEVLAPKETLEREDIREWLTKLPATDVRPRIVAAVREEVRAPAFALTLDEALGRYVEEQFVVADQNGADLVHGMTPDAVVELGRSLLAATPGSRSGAKLGSKVSIGNVRARDFCALRGEISINLRERGPVLICGPIGVGKTALLDSITWCFFGSTTPRKPGATTASLRADEVIHDDADSTAVSVELFVHEPAGVRQIEVTRSKARGKGAGVTIKGLDAPDGIDAKDGDALIRYVLGLDFGLWRACVSLGQGAVGNFVTGADKARKELLSGAYGLDVCPAAQKVAKDRAKALEYQVDKARIDLASARRVRETLGEQSFDLQIAEWETQHEQTIAMHAAAHEEARIKIAECDQYLAAEASWLASKTQFDEHITALTRALGNTTAGTKAAELQKSIGGTQAERGLVEQQIARARSEAEALVASVQGQQSAPCPTCQQPWGRAHVELHVQQIEQRIAGLTRSLTTLAHREENLTNEARNASEAAERVRAGYQREIDDARAKLGQVMQALQQFAVFRANRTTAMSAAARAETEIKKLQVMQNPWKLKASEHSAQIARIDAEIVRASKVVEEDGPRVDALRFWVDAFGPGGVPQLVLRTAMHELETHANAVLSRIVGGRLAVTLVMTDDDLDIAFRKFYRENATWRERRYEQLSGGERRCVELAFSPFGLSELVFAKTGARVPVLLVDELTTHLGDEEKREVAHYLYELDRETIVIVDHDRSIQAEFEQVYDVEVDAGYRAKLTRRVK